MNYFAMKAMFASEELAALEAKLAKALRQKQYEVADFLMEEHDKLAEQVAVWSKVASARVNGI